MTKVDNNPANDVPSAVVWVTMPGREIKPGATSLLPLAMGPMPDTEAVYFDVIQTRSDGSIETWAGVDVPAAGAQHPAFALKLAPLEPGQVPEPPWRRRSPGRGADRRGRRSGGRGAGQRRRLQHGPARTGAAAHRGVDRVRAVLAAPPRRRERGRGPGRGGRRCRCGGPGSRPARKAEEGGRRDEGAGSGRGRGGRRAGPGAAPLGGALHPGEKGRGTAGGRPEIGRRRGHRHRRAPAWKRVETSRQYRGR